MTKKKSVHIVGTHGVPAKYGGFETLADFLCQYLKEDYAITVYCNSKKYRTDRVKYYHGARLKYLNLEANGFKGIFYDLITYLQALGTADVILYLSPVGSGFMTPLKYIFRKKVIVNHGGLNEWEREKLSWIQKKWAKFNHRIAARFADVNITDNVLYQQSLKNNFNADSVVIRYGGDHVNFISNTDKRFAGKYSFVNEKYAISVSRAQLDNNLHVVLEAFESFDGFKLVMVSNWSISKYGIRLKEKYGFHPNIILLDAIYDKKELDFLRGNAYVYIHSHSRCGTAPSLVEAMCLGNYILSYDVPTNRETTKNSALYFTDASSLCVLLQKSDINDNRDKQKSVLKEIALTDYSWEYISDQYRILINAILKE